MTIDMKLTFGKHNGKRFSELPVVYIRWLSEQATIYGKKTIPEAAKAYLDSLPPVIANALHYPQPRTAEEAEKLAWMAGKGNKEAARTLLATCNEHRYISVDFEDADGEEGFFYVYPNGMGGYFAGTQGEIEERAREEVERAQAEAHREAHPDLEWISRTGESIKIWGEGMGDLEGDDQLVTVFVKGHKVEGIVLDVPAKQRTQAREMGIVAIIQTRLGTVGLTAERKARLDVLKKQK